MSLFVPRRLSSYEDLLTKSFEHVKSSSDEDSDRDEDESLLFDFHEYIYRKHREVVDMLIAAYGISQAIDSYLEMKYGPVTDSSSLLLGVLNSLIEQR